MRTKIKLLKHPPQGIASPIGQSITVKGWVKTVRKQKTFAFVEVNDGSTLSNLQVILNPELPNYETLLESLSTGTAVSVMGTIVESPGGKQGIEMQAEEILTVGSCDPSTYPLQKKRHSFEFLRTISHLRPRTNTLGAVARVRNALAVATHFFYQSKGFLWVNTPIITASDCEGAGELFRVTTLDLNAVPRDAEGKIDDGLDFFERPAYLTVSGQLDAEIFACALSDVYTFGPTFRAENSNTSRHLAEFWMVEPEMAFADLSDAVDNAEEYMKFVLGYVFEHCPEEMQFFDQFVSKGLIERLEQVLTTPFERSTYTYAVRVLEKCKKNFQYPVAWGKDLHSEHERYLCEEFFNKPVILTDYPKEAKAFYMRQNDDGKTVAAMDVLVPKVGEIVGGSQREERLDVLERRISEMGFPKEEYSWYFDLRRYGTVPHAGYGVGFERLLQFVSGMDNIRDVVPLPRTPGKVEF